MPIVSLLTTFFGYTTLIWGYSKWHLAGTGQSLTLSDIVLPGHRNTYMTAMAAPSATINPNTGKPATPGLQVTPAGLANAERLASTECSKDPKSLACRQAQQQVTDIKNGATA